MCCDSKLTYPFETAPHLLLPKSSHFPRYLLHLPLAQTDKTKAPTKHLYRRPTRDKSSVRDGLNHNRVNDHPSIVECSPSEHISHCLHPPRSLRLIRGHDTSTTTTMTEENWVHYHDGGIPGRRRVLTGAAAKSTFSELPKIDFRRIYSDDLADRQQLAQEVGAACRDIGFFYAVNHGVDESLLNDTFEATRKFFDLPTAVKMEVHNQRTSKFRGYAAVSVSAFVVTNSRSRYEAFLEGKLDPSTRGGTPPKLPQLNQVTNSPPQISKKAFSWAKTPRTPSKTAPSHPPPQSHGTNGQPTPPPSSGVPQSTAITTPCTPSANASSASSPSPSIFPKTLSMLSLLTP